MSLTLALVVLSAPLALGGAPDVEMWYDVTLDGASMGYSREWIETADDGNIITGVYTRMLVKRHDDLVRIEISERWTETPAGRPLEYHMSTYSSERETKLDLVIDGDKGKLRRAIGDDAVLGEIEIPSDMIFPEAARRLMVSHGSAPGTTYRYTGFDAESESAAEYTVVVTGGETLEIMGREVALARYEITCDARSDLPVHEWRDAEGRLWKYELSSSGMTLTRTTKEEAQAEREAFDVLTATAVPANVTIRAPFAVDDALLEVWLDDGADITGLIVEDDRQTIEGTTDRGVLLRVRRVTPDPATVARFPVRSTPMQEYMDGNPLMQTWYPRILGVASRQAWGTDQNIWKVSKNIETWVFEEVEKKGYGTGFASATEVLNSRAGDCSEHAVLMTAMVRSLSIPARLVSGLTHHQGEFVYHMWVEVWTGDAWYALDPTIGDGSVDAMHVKFADSSAERGNVSDLAVGILRVLGRLGVRVVEYTADGRTVRP